MILDLDLLLQTEELDPGETLVLRHRPIEAPLRRVFGWLAEEQPELFNIYQRSHGPRTEAALKRARHIVSCIGHEPGRALFVGIYRVGGSETITRAACNEHPDYRRLMALGMNAWDEADPRSSALLFDLMLTGALAKWKGRLVLDWPKPDRSWYRWASPARNAFPVHAMHEQSLLVREMPEWQDLVIGWAELQALPTRWRTVLMQWRGIYLIFDQSDGARYVGSACGGENLLGRWLDYAGSGHGGNRLLLGRDPSNFQFSVLQRLSPDLPREDVVIFESGWKTRLHTTAPFGLNLN